MLLHSNSLLVLRLTFVGGHYLTPSGSRLHYWIQLGPPYQRLPNNVVIFPYPYHFALTSFKSLGYFPGHLHAFWLIYRKVQAEERYSVGGIQCKSHHTLA